MIIYIAFLDGKLFDLFGYSKQYFSISHGDGREIVFELLGRQSIEKI